MMYKKYQYPLVVGDSCSSGLLIRILQRKIPLGVDGIPSDDDSDNGNGDEDDEDDEDCEAQSCVLCQSRIGRLSQTVAVT